LKKSTQRKRTTRFFIDAAVGIINEEGIDAITIRKVADRALYNSATLYNYFDNLDHLKSLAALTFVSDYTEALAEYVKEAKNTYEENLLVWECFYKYSYEQPSIFFSIFGKALDKSFSNRMREFYELYPEMLEDVPHQIAGMLTKDNIYDRSMYLLEACANDNYFNHSDLHDIDELLYFIYRGMMAKHMADHAIYPTEEVFVNQAVLYLKRVFDSYRIDT